MAGADIELQPSDWLAQLDDAVTGLAASLAEESDVLGAESRDPVAVQAVAERKQTLAAAIDALFRAPGLQGADLEAWINGHATADDLVRWQRIKTQAAQCQALNDINGAQILLLRQRVEGALSILLGGGETNTVYGRHGNNNRAAAAPIRTSYKA